MEILAFWILISVGAALLASRYNRNPIGWFILSVLLSPIIGFVWLLAVGPASRQQAHAGYQPTNGDKAPDNPPNQGSAGRIHVPGPFDPMRLVPPYARNHSW